MNRIANQIARNYTKSSRVKANIEAARISAEIADRLAAIDPLDRETTINVLIVRQDCLMISFQGRSWRDAVTRVLCMADDLYYQSTIAENDPVFMADAQNPFRKPSQNPSREQHTVASLRADRAAGRI